MTAGDPGQELERLARVLHDTDRRISELVDDQVDAVILPGGVPHLLVKAQRELATSEAAQRRHAGLLISLLGALPAHVALVDRQGAILQVNEAWLRFAEENGWTVLGGQGLNYLDVCDRAEGVGSEGAAEAAAGLRAVLEGATDRFEMEYACHAPDAQRWFRLVAAPTPEGAVLMHVDITASRAAEGALRESERRHREMFQANPLPMWVFDRETLRFLEVNASAVAHYGYSREEFLGMTVADIRPPEDVPGMLRALEGMVPGPRKSGLWRHRLRDGRIITVDVSSHPLVFDGRPARLVLAVDVTERVRAEEEVRRSRALLATASKVARMGAWAVDLPEGGSWSEEFAAILELPPDFVSGYASVFGLFHPQDRGPLEEAYARCARDGTPYDLVVRAETARGRTIWVRTLAEAVRDEGGAVVRVQGALQDVTEEQLARLALAASEERFRLVARVTSDVIWDWDVATGAIWYSDRLEAVFGHRRGEVGGTIEEWTRLIHPADRERVGAGLRRVLEGSDGQWSDRYRFRRRDGSHADIEDTGLVIRDLAGVAVRMIGGLTDVTDRNRAQRRVAEQAALIDQASDAIIVRDLDHRILFWSRGARRLYGWDAHEVVGHRVLENIHEGSEEVAAAMDAFRKTGEWSGEMSHRTKDGEVITVFARWSLLHEAFGETEAILAINTDVTESRKLRDQLLRVQRLESVGVLAGGIAHDLNNVLAPVMMAVDMLSEEVVSEEGRALVETLHSSAQRGADLIRQILTFAKGVDIPRAAVDVLGLARDLERLARETFPPSITFQVEAAEPPWRVSGDATQLHQVLMNLCVNARDAMPAGGRLTVRLENVVLDEVYAGLNPMSRPGPHLRVTVEDTGVGIPEGVRDRIFEPFFTTKGMEQGTGLGLSTCFTIVRDHGGFFNVYSEIGKGSRFQVFLPAVARGEDVEAGPAAPRELPRGNGEVVLVVDDEEAILDVARRALERYGYRVKVARHGAEAVSCFALHRDEIAVVLTDMSMPVMDGPALAVALRSIDPDVKIVGSSGLAVNAPLARAVGAGLQHFVSKPYTAESLLATLRQVLDSSTPARGGPPPSPPAPHPSPVPWRSRAPSGHRILVVDDEASLRRMMVRALTAEGHTVLAAGDGEEALALLEEHDQPMDLVLTDVQLGSMDGFELAHRIAQRHPGTRVALATGSLGRTHAAGLPVLHKPFTLDQLKEGVRDLLEARDRPLP